MKEIRYIVSSGRVKRKDNTIFFETAEGNRSFLPVENTSEIMFFGEVELNSRALEFFSQKEIIAHFFSYYGYYMGSFYPREHYNSGYMILNQSRHFMNTKKRMLLAKNFVRGSKANILKVLKYYNKGKGRFDDVIEKIGDTDDRIRDAKDISTLLSTEAYIREEYYSVFDKIISDKDFAFDKRTRRPPKNNLNALISFGNSLVYITVLSQIYKTHLDPRIGYLHETNFRRFTLNLDIAEIFKPIITDRVIFSLLNKKQLTKKHFHKELNGILLNDAGKRIFLKQFDEKLKQTIRYGNTNKKVSYKRLIRMECYKLEKHLMGDKKYKPFVINW